MALPCWSRIQPPAVPDGCRCRPHTYIHTHATGDVWWGWVCLVNENEYMMYESNIGQNVKGKSVSIIRKGGMLLAVSRPIGLAPRLSRMTRDAYVLTEWQGEAGIHCSLPSTSQPKPNTGYRPSQKPGSQGTVTTGREPEWKVADDRLDVDKRSQ